jgi:hypothetical protein
MQGSLMEYDTGGGGGGAATDAGTNALAPALRVWLAQKKKDKWKERQKKNIWMEQKKGSEKVSR